MTFARPLTLAERIDRIVDCSEPTNALLVDLILNQDTDDWEVILSSIALVLAGKPHEMDEDFEDRVWESMTYTREDGGSIFDSDYDR